MMMFDGFFGNMRIRRRRRPKDVGTIFLLISILSLFQEVISLEERICTTIDMRNTPGHVFGNKKAIQNCTVLEGSVTLSMIYTNDSVRQEDFLRFENLREITGYLLVFQVKGLKSLSYMFPKLRVIGGQQLIMNYALIIFQNDAMEEVGLPNLTTIRNGGVRIAENGLICYAKNIDWQHIISGPVNDLLIHDGSEGGIRTCNDDCIVPNPETCRQVQNQLSCWNETVCQNDCPYDRDGSDAGPGCAISNGEKCHQQCVGGCEKPNDATQCISCRKFIHKSRCVEKCPAHLFAYLNRRCVTEKECLGFSKKEKFFKATGGTCNHQCPEGFQEDPNNKHACLKCERECPRICQGKHTVDSLTSALKLSKCNIIAGSLEIELRTGMDSVAPEKLTEAFGKIEIIEGYLLIRFSPAFVSLHMFKNLKVINGTGELFRNKYSVVVFENANLRQLFPTNVTVEKGHIQFQNNRMLCYYKIKEWMLAQGKANELDEIDQSSFSNGDKAICEESTFEVAVVSLMNHGFILEWQPFNTSDIDHRKFLGYQVFYKKVDSEDENLSIDDDRSACSDSWDMHFESESDQKSVRGAIIAGDSIKANTLYAFYVQTRMVNHPGARNAVSKIGFIRTIFGTPSSPILKTIGAISNSQIEIKWDPPEEPNGDITHYRIKWYRIKEDAHLKNVCDMDSRRDHAIPPPRMLIDPDTSPALGFSQLTGQAPSSLQKTCSKIAGCCECGGVAPTASDANKHPEQEIDAVEDETHFENAIQNVIFVSQCVNNPEKCKKGNGTKEDEVDERGRRRLPHPKRHRPKRLRRAIAAAPGDKDTTIGLLGSSPSPNDTDDYTPVEKNVTGFRYVLEGLKHYADYHVSIEACQNTSHRDNYCSQRPAFKPVRTFAIAEADLVANDTIFVDIVVVNGTSNVNITWEEPSDPNGHILGYRVKVINTAKQATPIDQCVNRKEYNESGGGILFKNLNDGDYQVEVRTITLKGTSDASTPTALFKIRNPGFFTWKRLLIGSLIMLGIFIIAGVSIWKCVRLYYGKRIGEFVRQTISANPEYLSQMDVYKQDEWELQRSDLTLEEEIGRGTFGKVFRGRGHNVRSQCGEFFGECAIKTVTESANSAERLHFLIEASVMKQFNTSFIVKLYGVVSDGQPVLVVMEMMGKGNLRDYLRSRRPDADENTNNLPLPTSNQYFEWAAQIADGMAYLEHLKFCHRDLAARNCMVHADETVKIGDFGMARDIYYHEYYKPTGKRLMPVRWMAPESLKDGKFTMKSDVWSYGIVLYEMLTLAQQPYQGLANDEVFNFIGVSRKILEKPTDCPDWWYDIMTSCWRYQARERPSFHQLVQHILPYTTDDFKTKSFVVNGAKESHHHSSNSATEEPAYVPEGHGHRLEMEMANHDDEIEGAVCTDNRADSESPGWLGEGDGFVAEVEDEL